MRNPLKKRVPARRRGSLGRRGPDWMDQVVAVGEYVRLPGKAKQILVVKQGGRFYHSGKGRREITDPKALLVLRKHFGVEF